MRFEIPQPLKIEHDQLHNTLRRATREPAPVGDAARAVAQLMHPHFVKEEEYALPPLALLPALAQGPATAEMKAVLPLTDKLKQEMPQMLAEHKAIVAALAALADAAKRAGKPEYADFAQALMLHAQSEEQVMYPAALLVGQIVRAQPVPPA